jgi:uncharacterized protein (DUF1800 family)
MRVSRRRFLTTSSALAATAAAPLRGVEPPDAYAAPAAISPRQSGSTPSLEAIAMHRMAFGPRPGDIAQLRSLGFAQYVEQQLQPDTIDDSACEAKISAARLKISYEADPQGRYPARNEATSLGALGKTTQELWSLRDFGQEIHWSERMRPFNELRVATWLRAIYSKRQLKELLVDFWHNHFNVSASASAVIACALPDYDRIMRQNCLGNFRSFLEQVAKSTAMLYYLDNVSNRDGGLEGGNENYTRELFELHTLGSDNYLGFIDDPIDRERITTPWGTFVKGYADNDVYEAARCFTGWTVANGHWERPALNDGSFLLDEGWHDGDYKLVLGAVVKSRQGALKDGQTILDRLASHPGTARHLCTKLCRRFVADDPPQALVDAAVNEWMASISAPDQIARVLRVILLSDAFKTTWGRKVKRPFEAVVAFLRATNAASPVDEVPASNPAEGGYWFGLFYGMEGTGHRLFEWGPPTGHPDLASYWASSNSILTRWNLLFNLSQRWGGNFVVDIVGQTDLGQSCTQIVDFWIDRLCGYAIGATARQELIRFLAQGGDASQPPRPLATSPDWNDAAALRDRLYATVQLLAMTPDFSLR